MSSHQPSSITHHPSPADRAHLPTEHRLDASRDVDALDTTALLAVINAEDAKVAAAVGRAAAVIAEVVDAAAAGLRAGGRLVYLGAGTSGRLGVLDASECPPTFHCPPEQVVGIIAGGDGSLRRSSEGREDEPDGAAAELDALQLTDADTVVGIAAGGTTPYVHGALRRAKERGCVTSLVTCVPAAAIAPPPFPLGEGRGEGGPPHAPLHTYVDHVVELLVGPEVVTGSTRMKAGTATKLALNMISTGVMIKLGKTWGNLMVDVRATNAKLRDRAARILTSQTDLPRDAALALLDAAGGRVKVALVMALRRVDAAAAQELLDTHAGRLRPILGAPR